jgi:hypothetical protein
MVCFVIGTVSLHKCSSMSWPDIWTKAELQTRNDTRYERCFVADIYVTSGVFILNVVLNLKIIKNYISCIQNNVGTKSQQILFFFVFIHADDMFRPLF